MASQPPRSSTGREPLRLDIQGLRALAIALVIIDHLDIGVFRGGYIGVDVFFVISGFLITSHLVARLDSTGKIGFSDFYARRMRRILPVSFLVLVLTTAAALIWMPPLTWPQLLSMAAATAAYVPNVYLAVNGTNYQAETAPLPLQHYWSLGVEEQFYLFWPLILFLVWLLVRRSRRLTVALLAAGVAVSFAACVWLTFRSQPWAFFSLPTRAWELGVGGLVAMAAGTVAFRQRVPSLAASLIAWLGLGAIVACAQVFNEDTWFPGYNAAIPVLATAAVIAVGARRERAGPLGILAIRPVQYVGKVSYSLYLWHWPLLVIPQAAIGLATELPVWVRVALMVIAVGLSALSFRYVEEPWRRSRRLNAVKPRHVVTVGLSVTVTLTTLALVARPIAEEAVLATDTTVLQSAPTSPPSFTTFVPSNLDPSIADAEDSTSTVHRNGCHISDEATVAVNDCVFGDIDSMTSIALFGDSHAAHWFGAAESWATSDSLKLFAYTKVGCPSVDVSVISRQNVYEECDEWRERVIEKLNSDSPDVVIVSNSSHYEFAGDPASREHAWGEGLERLREELKPDIALVVVADTPKFVESVPRCLSAHLTNALACGADRDAALDASWLASEDDAATALGIGYANLDDFFCSPTGDVPWGGGVSGRVASVVDVGEPSCDGQ